MSLLPANWVRAPIGSLCDLKNGRAFKPAEWTQDGLPIVRIQNLNNASAPFNRFKGAYDNKHYLKGGELLFAWSGTPGTSFGAHVWRGGEALLNQHIFRVDFDGALLDRRFFRHAINQKLTELIGVAHGGAGLQHVTKGVFEGTEVALPPREEQRRIADKLDTVLTRVDAVSARLARVAPLLKRFRQSVLAAATSGRLTEDWRDANPSSSSWNDCQIGDLLREKPRNGYSPKAVDQETPVRSLTLSATTTGRFRPECFKFVPDDIPLDSHLWIAKDDVLIQRANSLEYVGVSAVVDVELGGYIYPDLMMKCRANERTSSAFLHLLLSSADIRKHFREHATGTAGNMPKINQQTVISAPCRVPGIKEQTEIVRRVETLFAYADRLEARLKAAQTATGRLTPALLAKAFRGELVPQDPDDEPASELLRRLQAASGHRSPARAAGRGRKRST